MHLLNTNLNKHNFSELCEYTAQSHSYFMLIDRDLSAYKTLKSFLNVLLVGK